MKKIRKGTKFDGSHTLTIPATLEWHQLVVNDGLLLGCVL